MMTTTFVRTHLIDHYLEHIDRHTGNIIPMVMTKCGLERREHGATTVRERVTCRSCLNRSRRLW